MNAPLNILLVEDNPGDVAMVRAALRSATPECHITVAGNGSHALELLQTPTGAASPDFILLDINMPRMDGKEFLTIIKSEDSLKTIPVVMFTSSDSPKDIRECYERHASSYVVKPFDGVKYANALQQIVSFWGDLSKLPAKII